MNTVRAIFPMTPPQAYSAQAAYARAKDLPISFALPLTPDVAMRFMLIPPGEFRMGMEEYAFRLHNAGAPDNDQHAWDGLLPHLVQVETPFYLGRTAVTQAQWQAVMGSNPSFFSAGGELPAEHMTVSEAAAYCQALSALTGRQARLPSESEWEYACRAGSPTFFHFGDSEDQLGQYAWYRANSGMVSHPVGLKLPNPWGLYDMHGGIDEYCQDLDHPSYHGAPTDQRAWMEDGVMNTCILRGGSWYDIPVYCSSPHSNSGPNDHPSEDHGLRVVLEIPAA
jgi:formylglycine-generating enzyme required for sulfatase activity